MPGACDTSAQVDVGADVALRCDVRRSRVKAHPDPNRSVGQRSLSCLGGGHGIPGRTKGNEEGVALGIDLDPSMASKRVAQEGSVLSERAGVALGAQLVEQSCGAVDVSEQERDRS